MSSYKLVPRRHAAFLPSWHLQSLHPDPSSPLSLVPWHMQGSEGLEMVFGGRDRLRISLKTRNDFIGTMLGAASQGVPHAAQCCVGWCPSPTGNQGKAQYFRDKAGFPPALWMTSRSQGEPAPMDSGAAAEPGPGATLPNHPLSLLTPRVGLLSPCSAFPFQPSP